MSTLPRPFAFVVSTILALSSHALLAHEEREIQFPDIPGYLTLSCDLHSHTVFSDGAVWPTIRVEEAHKDGLDLLVVSDHLEYQPHRDDIPHPDRNRSFQIIENAAQNSDLLVVNGAEVTRDMPPGHVNAVFIEDANALLIDDPVAALREANRQGGFVFWNHPNWVAQRSDGMATLTDMHRDLIAEGLLHGIEVVNEMTYSDEALRIALDNDLTILANSDIHGLVDWQFNLDSGGHRPATLVFAKERTTSSMKEALFAGRTVAWFNNLLIGKPEYLRPLIVNSIQLESSHYEDSYAGPSTVAVLKLANNSDASYLLKNLSPYTLHMHADIVTLPAHETTEVQVKILENVSNFTMHFEVLNAITAPAQHPTVAFEFAIEPAVEESN